MKAAGPPLSRMIRKDDATLAWPARTVGLFSEELGDRAFPAPQDSFSLFFIPPHQFYSVPNLRAAHSWSVGTPNTFPPPSVFILLYFICRDKAST
jgi:hypothetical protein